MPTALTLGLPPVPSTDALTNVEIDQTLKISSLYTDFISFPDSSV